MPLHRLPRRPNKGQLRTRRRERQKIYVAVPPEVSPALELTDFATFTGVSPGDTINAVVVTVSQFQSSALMGPPTIELWDYSGTPALIGTGLGAVTTSTANIDSFTYPGVTYAQLATLRVHIYANQGTAARGAIQNVNWAGLYANITPVSNTAGLATGTGSAKNAQTAIAVSAGLASAAATALSSAFPDTSLASGTGAALNPAAAVGVTAVLASGAATARNANPPTPAVLASGTGAALNPAAAVGVTAVLATGAATSLSSAFPLAGLASGTGTAQNPAAAVGVTAVLAIGAATSLSSAFPLAGLASGTGAAQNITAGTSSSGTATAVLATGTATALSSAFPDTSLASGTGVAQSPVIAITVTAVLATGTGAALNTAFTYAHAGLATGTGTAAPVTAGGATFRLFPATNGPGTAVSYTGNFVAAVLFEVTQATCWFQGYWWWVCGTGQSTTPVKCSLGYYGGDFDTGTAYIGHVAASAATSGTLTAGAWNYIPLATPVQLTPGTGYLAMVGVNGNFPYTASSFNTGDTYAAGITSGPLTCFSGVTGTTPGPYGVQNMLFETATGDPELVTGLAADTSGDHASNFWVDVQVSGPGATPPGYAGSYRLFPSSGTDTATEADSALNYVVGTEVHLAQLCTLNKIWFYSYSAANQLPTACTVWDMGTQASVAGTASPSWSGAAGSGWMSCTFTGVTLPAGSYYVTVYDGAATPTLGWSAKRLSYWGGSTAGLASPGLGGIVNGPLSAPDTAHAATVYQWANNSGSTPPYTSGVTEPGQSVFAQGPPNQYPYLYVDGLYQNYWVDLEVTAGVNAAAGLATGTGTAQNATTAISVTAVLASGAATALSSAFPDTSLATGTGAAQGAVPAIGVNAGLATGTGTALNPGILGGVVTSPALEGYGFGSFSQVPAGSVVVSVIAAITVTGSNIGIGAPSYQLWDGTSAQIGASQNGVASTDPAHIDTVTFTGITYSQLSALRLRMFCDSASGNSGATASADAVSLSVVWAPAVSTTVPAAVLAVPAAFPAPAVSTGMTAAPAALAVAVTFPGATAGLLNATVQAVSLTVPVQLPAPAVSAVTAAAVTPAALAVAVTFPGSAAGLLNATAAPGALTVAVTLPLPAASGVTTASAAPAVLAVAVTFPGSAAGVINSAVLPGVLAAAVAFPGVTVTAVTSAAVTPGTLAVLLAFPAATVSANETSPAWTSAQDIPVAGSGTWVNPGNIIGVPDGADAVWTTP